MGAGGIESVRWFIGRILFVLGGGELGKGSEKGGWGWEGNGGLTPPL